MKTLKLVALLILLCVFSGGYAFAYNYTQTPKEYLTVKWADSKLPINYYFSSGTNTDMQNKAAVIDLAFATWSNVRTGNFSSFNRGAHPISAPNATDGINTFYFYTSNWPYEATLPAKTIVTYDSVTGEISDVDVMFNGVNFQWSTSGESGRYDLQAVATHEIGHLLGLLDSPETSATMWGSYGVGDVSARTLAQDDISGVAFLYPNANPAAEPPAPAAGSVFLPYLLYYSSDFESYILIQNTSDAPVSASVSAYTASGKYAGSKSVIINGHGRAILKPEESASSTPFFGELALNDTYYFAAVSSGSIQSLNVLGFYNAKNATNSKDLIFIQPMKDAGQSIYFPHFASDYPYETYVSLVNLSSLASNASIEAYDASGNLVTRGVITVPAYGVTFQSLRLALQSNGSTYASPLSSLKVTGESGSVVGQLVFINSYLTAVDEYGEGTERNSVGATSFSQSGATSFVFPYLLGTSAWQSYLLFTNVGDSTVNYTMTGYNSSGTNIGQVSQSLGAHSKALFNITKGTFNADEEVTLSVRVTCDSSDLRAVAAYVSNSEFDFVIVPALPAAKTLYSAFSDNSGLKLTYLQITNAGDELTMVTIKAYNDNGEKLYEATRAVSPGALFMDQITKVISGYTGSTNLVITSDTTDISGMVIYYNNTSTRLTYNATPLIAK